MAGDEERGTAGAGTDAVRERVAAYHRAAAGLSADPARTGSPACAGTLPIGATPDAIIVHDAGVIVDANDRAAQLSGYARSELVGMNSVDVLVAPQARQVAIDGLTSENPTAEPYELMLMRKDGSPVAVEIRSREFSLGGRGYRVATARDLTAHKRATDELGAKATRAQAETREVEGRYRALFQNLPVPAWEQDLSRMKAHADELAAQVGGDLEAYFAADRARLVDCIRCIEILDVNLAARALFESESAEEWLAHLPEVFTERSLDAFARHVVAVQRGESLGEIETEMNTLTGARREVAVRWTVLPGHEKHLDRVMVTLTDLTEQKQLQAQLVLADRMASVGLLAAGVAHEINNPLTYVLANLQLIERSLFGIGDRALRAKLLKLADDAQEGTERVRSIIRDLGTFARRDEELRATDVKQILESSLRMVEQEIRPRALLVCDYGRMPAVRANASRLGQVFVNLLINAVQAMPEGLAEHNELSVATWQDPKGQATIEISDSGVGIAPADLEHIFDPFFSTKPLGKGTGLGLSICHNIIRDHGGTIEVESEPGKGTRFRLSLPPARQRARRTRSRTRSSPGLPLRRLRILVVEDEEGILNLMREALEAHDLTVAETGRRAIEALSAAEFDVVLCDLLMPDLTGMDVYEHLQKKRPGEEEKIIFMTGGAFTARAREFLDRVPNDRLQKPFDLLALEHAIARRTGQAG